jgi:hypothetical protein
VKCQKCGGTPEISHCAGNTGMGGRSECHAEQCHMVYDCHRCRTRTYGGCGVARHRDLIREGLVRVDEAMEPLTLLAGATP